MLKSFAAGVAALLAATFGAHHTPITANQSLAHQVDDVAMTQRYPVATGSSTALEFQDLSSQQHSDSAPTSARSPSAPGAPSNTSASLSSINSRLSTLTTVVQGIVSIIPALRQQSPTLDAALQQQVTSLQTQISLTNRITQLPASVVVSGVSGLTESDIPDLSGKYVKVGGGNTVSGLSQFASASTTLFSAFGPAWFGSTATSTFGTDGSLTLTGALSANSSAYLASTTLSGKTLLTSATSTNFFSTTASTTNLFAQTASLGSLSLASPLSVASGGTGTTTWQIGSIPFSNGNYFTENNGSLFWDNTHIRLGIGTTTPGSILSVQGVANFATTISTFYTDLNIAFPNNRMLIGSKPFISTPGYIGAPGGVNGETNLIIGQNAGLNVSTSATLATIIGTLAGGSNGENQPYDTGGIPGSPNQCSPNCAGGTGLTGIEDTFIGWHAGTQMTIGGFDTAIGVHAMGLETTGSNSIAIGNDAMRDSIGVWNSVAIGNNALREPQGGTNYNIAIGDNALEGTSTDASYRQILVTA